MSCINHPDKVSLGLCNYCAKSICSDCAAQVKGELYCKDCLDIKFGAKKHQEHSPAVAAILSFVIAGLGQIYNGQIAKGLLIFFTSLLIFPWIIGIFDAYNTAKRINNGEISVKRRIGCVIAFAIGIFVFWIFIIVLAFIVGIAAAIMSGT